MIEIKKQYTKTFDSVQERASHVSLCPPNLGVEEQRAVLTALQNNWLTRGPLTEEFEHLFSEFTKSPYTLAVSSCTAAIHLALLSLGIKEGDSVLLPAITYVSTLHTLLHMKIKPILVDVDKITLNISLKDLKAKTNKECKALIVTDMLGRPCDYAQLIPYCEEHNITLIEDAAHSIGSEYNDRPVGSFAEITCFSFYPTKNLASAEGGALCTTHSSLYEKAKKLHMQGINHSTWKRHTTSEHLHWEVIAPGYKYNATDLQSAIAIEQLKKLPVHKKIRERLFNTYLNELQTLPELILPSFSPNICWYLFGIQIKEHSLSVTRDQFAQALMQANISVGFHFIPLHWHPYFKTALPSQTLPNSDLAGRQILSLPLHPQMTSTDILNIKNVLTTLLEKYRA